MYNWPSGKVWYSRNSVLSDQSTLVFLHIAATQQLVQYCTTMILLPDWQVPYHSSIVHLLEHLQAPSLFKQYITRQCIHVSARDSCLMPLISTKKKIHIKQKNSLLVPIPTITTYTNTLGVFTHQVAFLPWASLCSSRTLGCACLGPGWTMWPAFLLE